MQPDNGVILDAGPWLGYDHVQVGFGLFLERFVTGTGGIRPWLDQENVNILPPRRRSLGRIHPDAVIVSVWELGHPEDPIIKKGFYDLDDEVNIRDIEAFLREQGVVIANEQPPRPVRSPSILPMRPLTNIRMLRDLTNNR